MTNQILSNNARQPKLQLTGFSREMEEVQDGAYVKSGPYFPFFMPMMLR